MHTPPPAPRCAPPRTPVRCDQPPDQPPDRRFGFDDFEAFMAAGEKEEEDAYEPTTAQLWGWTQLSAHTQEEVRRGMMTVAQALDWEPPEPAAAAAAAAAVAAAAADGFAEEVAPHNLQPWTTPFFCVVAMALTETQKASRTAGYLMPTNVRRLLPAHLPTGRFFQCVHVTHWLEDDLLPQVFAMDMQQMKAELKLRKQLTPRLRESEDWADLAFRLDDMLRAETEAQAPPPRTICHEPELEPESTVAHCGATGTRSSAAAALAAAEAAAAVWAGVWAKAAVNSVQDAAQYRAWTNLCAKQRLMFRMSLALWLERPDLLMYGTSGIGRGAVLARAEPSLITSGDAVAVMVSWCVLNQAFNLWVDVVGCARGLRHLVPDGGYFYYTRW